MARLRTDNNGSKTWMIESGDTTPLSDQLSELAAIFNYEGRHHGPNRLLFQLLDYKATWLADAARRQERDMKSLKDDVRALKEALEDMKKEMAALKDPQTPGLDKPKPQGGLKL